MNHRSFHVCLGMRLLSSTESIKSTRVTCSYHSQQRRCLRYQKPEAILIPDQIGLRKSPVAHSPSFLASVACLPRLQMAIFFPLLSFGYSFSRLYHQFMFFRHVKQEFVTCGSLGIGCFSAFSTSYVLNIVSLTAFKHQRLKRA